MCDVVPYFDLSQPTVSAHLLVLREAMTALGSLSTAATGSTTLEGAGA